MTPSFEAMPSFSLVLHGWDQKFPFENLLQMFEAVSPVQEPSRNMAICR